MNLFKLRLNLVIANLLRVIFQTVNGAGHPRKNVEDHTAKTNRLHVAPATHSSLT